MNSIYAVTYLRVIFFIAFLFISSYILYAQFINTLSYKTESGIIFSKGKYTPLWLISNNQGFSSLNKSNGYLTTGIFCSYENTKNFTYELGLELSGAYNYTSSFFVHQAYAGIKYRSLEISLGSKERYGELKNSLLSSGGMLFSGNARPIPQIRIGIPEYTFILPTMDWLQIKGHVAYGRFTDDNFQEDFAKGKSKYNKVVLYHSKALFVKIGREESPLIFQGGLEMSAQFGGKIYYPDGRKVDIPSRLKDYLKVFVPMSGDELTTGADQVNVYGNHLGSWHASLKYRREDWSIRAYYEHFFEDHSQMFWEYGWKDGLIGVEIKFPQNPFIGNLVYEYIGTKDQSGPFLHDATEHIPDQVSANDNYYNHVTYSSWQHWGMGIGNPLLIAPLYNEDGNLSFRSNRMKAHHIGFNGEPTKEITYRILFSHARHWGTYHNPLPDVKYNRNGLVEVSYTPEKLKYWTVSAAIGVDRSNLIGNSTGGMVTICFRK